MNTTEALAHFEENANYYLQELNGYSIEQLVSQPHENEWSMGQMILHLINSSTNMSLRNIDYCLTQDDNSVVSKGEKTEAGQALMDQGGFPPIRIQVPASPQYTPGQPESKEQLVQGLNTVISRMKEVESTIEQASLHNTVAHPRFGGLNAKEWFMLVEMHFRHHLLQWDRLKQSL
ncbi:hypothetical protein PMSD_13925 [Paenibacillus macquariensis subsp. defensor]|nr:hypothetical protein PMSD_13925 [Paenibacillus macquariensis subsp. defensor]